MIIKIENYNLHSKNIILNIPFSCTKLKFYLLLLYNYYVSK